PSRVRWRGPERPRPIFPLIARREAGNRLGSATATNAAGMVGDFGFPDRHDALDLVHDPRTGREGFRAMDRGACDRDGIPADRDAAEPVDDGQVRETELVLGPLRERGEALDRHRTVHLVIEGFHPFVRADRPDEQDDGTLVIPPHAFDHGLEIDAFPPNLSHAAPQLTGGRIAASSPSRRTRAAAEWLEFIALRLEFLPCDLGPEGAEVAERVDPPAAPVLVMPEIQVRTSADLLRRDTASELHEPESGRPYSRVTVVTFPPGFRKKVKSHASVIFAH